jgi:hypothetical protein
MNEKQNDPFKAWTKHPFLMFVGFCLVLAPIIAIFSEPSDGSFERRDKAEAVLKASLRDPGSYELIGTSTSELNNGGKRLVIDYRAKNGFGGYGTDAKRFEFDANGSLITWY